MPCVFGASVGVNQIRLLINTIAAIGDEYVRKKKANLGVPVLDRLTVQEQQSLILAVATAIILGGHLEHTVRAAPVWYSQRHHSLSPAWLATSCTDPNGVDTVRHLLQDRRVLQGHVKPWRADAPRFAVLPGGGVSGGFACRHESGGHGVGDA